MSDINASSLEVGSIFREYGMDSIYKVAEVGGHGDTVLITSENGDEISLDIDTVVENMAYTPVEIAGKVTLANGRTIEFRIGDVAGDISYSQWGEVERVLYKTVPLMDGLVEKIHEDDLLVVIA